MHVCWHRNLSVSINDHRQAIKNQLSGYLLRKFKNSNGWQKLWVVFTNFCLFFYKTYQVICFVFVKHDLKGVLKCIRVKICTPHRRDRHYHGNVTDVTDILATTPEKRKRHLKGSSATVRDIIVEASQT
jgi:hypothetical protein